MSDGGTEAEATAGSMFGLGGFDPEDMGLDDLDLDLARTELLQGIGQRLYRAVHVALDDQGQVRDLTGLHQRPEVSELDPSLADP